MNNNEFKNKLIELCSYGERSWRITERDNLIKELVEYHNSLQKDWETSLDLIGSLIKVNYGNLLKEDHEEQNGSE